MGVYYGPGGPRYGKQYDDTTDYFIETVLYDLPAADYEAAGNEWEDAVGVAEAADHVWVMLSRVKGVDRLDRHTDIVARTSRWRREIAGSLLAHVRGEDYQSEPGDPLARPWFLPDRRDNE
uniref:Uncharacterized protein n=1 Tax=viral metagenome TaxID=1070528 RepID=A0A6M3LEP9_9ZZZZ